MNCSVSTVQYSSVQFSSVAQSCPTLCEPMDCNTPGLPAHHQLPEFIHTHIHWVSDAIEPSRPLSSPSPPALSLSQDQSLFQWVSSLHQVGKVLEFQLQHQLKFFQQLCNTWFEIRNCNASSIFLLLSAFSKSFRSLGSKWSPRLSIKLFQNPQGFLLPLSPSTFNNHHHLLLYTVVSFTDMLHLLNLMTIKARTKSDFSSPAFCPQLTVCKCVLIIMMLFICVTKL